MGIRQEIKRYFQTPHLRNGHFPWERVYSFLNSDFMNTLNRRHIGIISRCLSEFLSSYDCPDVKIVAASINLLALICNRGDLCIKDMNAFASQLREQQKLVNVRNGVDYDRLWAFTVIRSGDVSLMKILVRYGAIRFTEPQPAEQEMLWGLVQLCYLKRVATSPYSSWGGIPRHVMSMLAIVPVPSYGEAVERHKFLRRLSIFIVLLALIEQDLAEHRDIVKCLKLYFQAISDPFVTVKEIEEWLDSCHLPSDLLDKRRMKETFEEFKRHFPEWSILQPRCLQHLSRFAAREYLVERGPLPQVVSKLNIPNKIKDYILISPIGS